ncbi:MAG: heme/copper-type cytochrome/quinol oxidase subunit 3 [Myxococcota bacterium]|jgi:heme/copper-type cytochrome/quinol oxidase subunit 3
MRPIANTRSASGVPTGLLAVWWVVGSEIVIFGGVLASYIMGRLTHDAWAIQSANTNTTIGAINTFVLLTSSLTAVLAHQAAEQGNGKLAAQRLYLTMGGAVTFVCIKSFEWITEISHGFTITSSPFWSFYYTAAGIHAAHVIAGAIIMFVVAQKAKKQVDLHHVELIGIYWHFVDLVWIFLFPLLYIAK